MTLSLMPKSRGAKAAFLFPGQGAQVVGMGRELYEQSPAAREVFEQVDEALGRPLTDLLFQGPDEELKLTVNAQPAIMAVSLACIKAMEERLDDDAMPAPVVMAGHSLGEYTALAAAGVLDVSETAKLVDLRSRLMQEACDRNPGTMAAVLGLDEMTMEEVARDTGVYVSNVNTAEQIVISGDRLAIARALDLYANTPDDHFVIDWAPGSSRVLVAGCGTSHGFKFGSSIGPVIADALEDGDNPLGRQFRLGDRFKRGPQSGGTGKSRGFMLSTGGGSTGSPRAE